MDLSPESRVGHATVPLHLLLSFASVRVQVNALSGGAFSLSTLLSFQYRLIVMTAPYVKLLRESAMGTGYCMGWIPVSMNGLKGWMHSGLWEGFHAMTCFERRGRFACHALTSTGSSADGESPLAPLIMEMLKL